MKNLLKLGLLLLIIMIPLALLNGQNIGEIIDTVKNAESWTEIVGLYDLIMVGVVMIITQIKKIIPGLKEIKGQWVALVVAMIVLASGAILFGFKSLGSPIVLWAIATMVYDKFLKKEEKPMVINR